MIVLDTHAVLWWPYKPQKLGKRARRACERADRIGVSPMSIWEVGMLASRGRIRLRLPLSQWAGELLSGPRVLELPVTSEIAVLAAGLGGMHGDPADRIIIATAMQHGCKLVTCDEAIARGGMVETVWE